MPRVPPPFVAYLRVYEPLRAFEPAPRSRLERALAEGALPAVEAGWYEREVWLRTQLASPPRLLPGDQADGTAGRGPLQVLSLDPAEVPGAEPSLGPLVCPLDLRTRSAAALLGFLTTASPALVRVVLPTRPDGGAAIMKSRVQNVTSELGSNAVHVISATWTVPLPWFALVDPDTRQANLAARPARDRRVSWRATIHDARTRATRAHSVVQRNLGDGPPARLLADTVRWLAHFDPGSAVELDYGGLVQLMDDETLLADTSAHDVQAAVDAMENGEADQVALHYERLSSFWAEFAAYERFG